VRSLLKFEELGLFALSIFLFASTGINWWLYPLLLLAPDLGMLGYLLGPRVGATTYNLTHHKGIAVILYAIGTAASTLPLSFVGLVMLGHSSLDRVFGYGLKYPDAFHHTHLGWIGPRARDRADPSP
jgi:hypothetical protein